MSDRDKKLEEIAKGCLDVPTLTLSNPFTEARVKVVDLKQALQLAYKFGQDASEQQVTRLQEGLREIQHLGGPAALQATATLAHACGPAGAWDDGDDRPLPEDAEIKAAFPTRSGRHDLYAEAMRMVGAKYSKGGLVALVNWLLHRAEKK